MLLSLDVYRLKECKLLIIMDLNRMAASKVGGRHFFPSVQFTLLVKPNELQFGGHAVPKITYRAQLWRI